MTRGRWGWGVAVVGVGVGEAPLAAGGAGFDLGGEFLAAGELGDGEGVEPVHDVFVGEHDLQDFMQLHREALLAVAGGGLAQKAFVGYGAEISNVCVDEVVECAVGLRDGGLQLVPAGFDDLEEDVVLQLVDEVDHFCNAAAGYFPVAAELAVVDRGENAAGAGHAAAPGAAEGEFDTFDAPQEVEDYQVLLARPGSDDNVDGGVDFVFEGEDVPAYIAVTELDKAGV